MKKLFMMVALSLLMVACNKDEENELSYWDKVVDEMGETKLSVNDVLKSLRDNEYWGINLEYDYYEKNGIIIESPQIGDGIIAGGGTVIHRYVDDFLYVYTNNGPNWKTEWKLSIINNNGLLSFYDNEKFCFEYKIIAYDEKQVLIEQYYPQEDIYKSEEGNFLYKKILIKKQISDTKWWEKATPTN